MDDEKGVWHGSEMKIFGQYYWVFGNLHFFIKQKLISGLLFNREESNLFRNKKNNG